MALAFSFIKLDQLNTAADTQNKPHLSDALVVTGSNVIVFDRPVVDGNPTDPVEVETPDLWGGYTIVGKQGTWYAMVLASTEQKINAINNQAALIGNLMILLAVGVKSELFSSGYDWDGVMSQEDRDFINGKIVDANLPIDSIQPGETDRQVMRRLFRYFVPTFEIEQFSLMDKE